MRTCSFNSRFTVVQQTHNQTIDLSLPSPRIPIEIIDRIIELALSDALFSSPGASPFSKIAPFTFASGDFRQLALRRYFHELYLKSSSHWSRITELFKQGGLTKGDGAVADSKWVRSLHAPSNAFLQMPEYLASFTCLQKLCIDFSHEGLSTQYPRLKTLLNFFENCAASTNLRSLVFTALPRIDVTLLQLIVTAFPSLLDLHLSCTERLELECCWMCFEESLTRTDHSPIPEMFCGVEHLANAFGYALKPLTNLTYLHLGIFLCDEELLYSHVDHSLDDDEDGTMGMGSSPECSMCKTWVKTVHRRELEATLIIAQRLKSLRSIGWSSYFDGVIKRANDDTGIIGRIRVEDRSQKEISEDCHLNDVEDDDSGKYASKAKIWIQRTNGRIRVRKSPWH